LFDARAQIQSAACGTRPRELSNGWARKRKLYRLRWATSVEK